MGDATSETPLIPNADQLASGAERRVVALFDLDGTITKRDTYIPFLLGFLLSYPARLWRVGSLPFAVVLHGLGLRDNAWLKAHFLAAVLGGASRSEIDPWAAVFVERVVAGGLRRKARSVIEHHRIAGICLSIVAVILTL